MSSVITSSSRVTRWVVLGGDFVLDDVEINFTQHSFIRRLFCTSEVQLFFFRLCQCPRVSFDRIQLNLCTLANYFSLGHLIMQLSFTWILFFITSLSKVLSMSFLIFSGLSVGAVNWLLSPEIICCKTQSVSS